MVHPVHLYSKRLFCFAVAVDGLEMNHNSPSSASPDKAYNIYRQQTHTPPATTTNLRFVYCSFVRVIIFLSSNARTHTRVRTSRSQPQTEEALMLWQPHRRPAPPTGLDDHVYLSVLYLFCVWECVEVCVCERVCVLKTNLIFSKHSWKLCIMWSLTNEPKSNQNWLNNSKTVKTIKMVVDHKMYNTGQYRSWIGLQGNSYLGNICKRVCNKLILLWYC